MSAHLVMRNRIRKNLIWACSALLLLVSPCFTKDCYEATIQVPNTFMGNDGEVFKLSDGTIWQVQYEYEYLYKYYPDVVICPSEGKLLIEGRSLEVVALSGSHYTANDRQNIIETYIDGEFNGWEGDTIFKLGNGQIWQQESYDYTYNYAYNPKVLIFKKYDGYYMSVEGVSSNIKVRQLI